MARAGAFEFLAELQSLLAERDRRDEVSLQNRALGLERQQPARHFTCSRRSGDLEARVIVHEPFGEVPRQDFGAPLVTHHYGACVVAH